MWGREGKLAKRLITKHGSDILLWMPPPEGYKVSSLMWFFTDLGENYINDQRFEYKKATTNLTSQKPSIPLSETKIGDDINIVNKPRTLKEFLNYGKTIANQRREEGTDTAGTA